MKISASTSFVTLVSALTLAAACTPQDPDACTPGLDSRSILITLTGDSWGLHKTLNTVDVVQGDFNGDERLDLVMLSTDDTDGDDIGDVARVTVLYARDDGSYHSAVIDKWFGAPGAAGPVNINDRRTVGYGLAAADLDRDGALDLAIGIRNAGLKTGIITISGENFKAIAEKSTFASLAVTEGHAVNVGFSPTEGAPVSITAGDVNGDGCPELVAALAGTPAAIQSVSACSGGLRSSQPRIIENRKIEDPADLPLSETVFTATRTATVEAQGSVAIAVVTGSADDQPAEGRLHTFVWDPARDVPGFSELPTVRVASRPIAIAVADLDLDGLQDVVVASQEGKRGRFTRAYTRASADGRLSVEAGEETELGLDAQVVGLAAHDLTGDGAPDLAVTAHELTHVVQQGSRQGGFLGAGGMVIVLDGIDSRTGATGAPKKSFASKLGGFARGALAGTDELLITRPDGVEVVSLKPCP
jgi:hypothetical protein